MKLLADLEHMAITTFAVDPQAQAAFLPADLAPDVFPWPDGRPRALVSAVSFHARRVRWPAFPWPQLAYPQVNHRAYVRGPEGRGVWFFRMTVGSRALALSQRLRGLAMDSSRLAVEARWDGPKLMRYRLERNGMLELEAAGAATQPLAGFSCLNEALQVLTHPLVGYATTLGGRRVRFEVGHSALEVGHAEAAVARFGVFEDLGLVPAGTRPHSVLVTRRAEFRIEPVSLV